MADKFTINLLPPDVIMMDKQSAKLTWANKFSVSALLVLVALTSATFGIRFFQNSAINSDNQGIVLAQNQIGDLKSKEAAAVFLSKRLNSIQSLLGDNKKGDMFVSISALTPPDTQISIISVEKSGSMIISASAPTVASIESFLITLQDKNKTTDLVSKIDLENLTKSRDGLYRYDLKISPKK